MTQTPLSSPPQLPPTPARRTTTATFVALAVALISVGVAVYAVSVALSASGDLSELQDEMSDLRNDSLGDDVTGRLQGVLDTLQEDFDAEKEFRTARGVGIIEAFKCLDENWSEYIDATNEDRGGEFFTNCADRLTVLTD